MNLFKVGSQRCTLKDATCIFDSLEAVEVEHISTDYFVGIGTLLQVPFVYRLIELFIGKSSDELQLKIIIVFCISNENWTILTFCKMFDMH